MTSLLSNLSLLDTNPSGGIFSSLEQGGGNLNGTILGEVAYFTGAIAILAGIVFLVVAVVKTREKIRWFWMAGGAILVGAALIFGAAPAFQKTAGNTWGEVFKTSTIALLNFFH